MVSKKSGKKSVKKATKKAIGKEFEDSFQKSVSSEHYCMNKSCSSCQTTGGCIWFLGFVGAAVYYLSIATGFWSGVLAILKALVWPTFLVLKLLAM